MHPRVLVQPAEQLRIHAGHAGGRFQEAFAIGVFSHRGENFPHGALDARQIDVAVRRCRRVAFIRFYGEAAIE